MANLTYAEMNDKYRRDIRRNLEYLRREIPLDNILPHLHQVLDDSEYDSLRKRNQLKSESDCNQDLLKYLDKQEYWWQDFRQALVNIKRDDIIETLGWDEETFDFGPACNRPVVKRPPERNKKSTKEQTLKEFTPENPPENPACQSNMASSTTDVIQPSIASTVDQKGLSRNNNMRSERIIRLESSNLNREPDSYVTGLHSTGSDVTSSIRSGGQSSNLSQEVLDPDQTNVKYFDSMTRVDALDDWNLYPASIQSDYSNNSSSQTPDAMRLDPASKAGDVTTAPPVVENLNLSNSGLAQNPSSTQNPASTQNPVDTMPKFDSLLSGSQSLLPNQNFALTDLPLVQNSNIPEFSELLSKGSSVDPVDNSEPGARPVSVAYPPSTGQLAGMERESLNQSQDQEGLADNANSTSHDTAHNEARPSFLRKLSNSVGRALDSLGDKLFPSAE